MSKKKLNLLNKIGLLSNNTTVDLGRFDDSVLKKLLQYYYDECSQTTHAELAELRKDESLSALVSSFSAQNAVIPLLPSFLIHGHIVVDDPFFRICVPEHEITTVQTQWMGIKAGSKLDRALIANKLLYFAELAPLITADLLTVLPLHMLHFPPEQLPIFYAEDRFRSEIPENIHDFIHRSAVINPVILHKESGSLLIPKEPVKEPCRAISISFANDYTKSGVNTYFLHRTEVEEIERASGRIKMRMSFAPGEPLDQDFFDAWVYQSINRTIIARLQAIASEVRLASSINHSYITESQFESLLLSKCGFKGEDASAKALNFLKVNDSLIKIPSAGELVRLREKHAKAFSRFRASLLATAEKLQGVSPDQFPEKAERLYRTDIQPQIDEIRKSIRSISTSLRKGALQSLGVVALAIASGTALPLIAASLYVTSNALTETLPALSDYMSSRRKPEYIWKQIQK